MTEIATRTRAGVYRIEDLVGLVAEGRLRVPEFQRNFRWYREDVLSLFDSVLKGYPVGSLLLWQRPAPRADVRLGELHILAPEVTDAMWVVDGQQRITAIANAVSQEAYEASDRFRIDFDLSKRAFVPGGGVDGELKVPLPVLFDLRRLLEWSRERPDAAQYIGAANDVAVRLRDFSVPASIVAERDDKTLREIFDRTNNAGRKLKRAEIFHALFSEKGDDRATIEAIADELEEADFGRIDGNTVLHAVLARRHGDFSRNLRLEFTEERGRNLDVPPDDSRGEALRGGREALRRAITFLQEHAGVPHVAFLPYKPLLTTLAKFFAHHPNPHPRNEDLLVRWFWRAALAPTTFGGGTAMGRRFVSRVNPDEESRSVHDLLALVPDDVAFIRPKVDEFRTNAAATRVVLCALYESGPRRFSDGRPLDVKALAESLGDAQSAQGVIADVIPRRHVKDPVLAAGVGRRFLLADDDMSIVEAQAVLARTESTPFSDVDAIATSHLVDEQSSAALREGRYDDFLRRRRDAVDALVERFLQVRMGLTLPANGPLDDYDLDEDDLADAAPDDADGR